MFTFTDSQERIYPDLTLDSHHCTSSPPDRPRSPCDGRNPSPNP